MRARTRSTGCFSSDPHSAPGTLDRLEADTAVTVKPPVIFAQAVKVLQEVIPSWRPLELDPCEQCEGTLEQSVAEADKLKVRQSVDKVSRYMYRRALGSHTDPAIKEIQKNVKSLDNQIRLGSGRLPIGQDPQAHYVIPKGLSFVCDPLQCPVAEGLRSCTAEWSRKWVKWLQKKGSLGPADLPPRLGNDQFLCEHNLLCLDLVREAESAREITVVQPKEWAYLKKMCVFSRTDGSYSHALLTSKPVATTPVRPSMSGKRLGLSVRRQNQLCAHRASRRSTLSLLGRLRDRSHGADPINLDAGGNVSRPRRSVSVSWRKRTSTRTGSDELVRPSLTGRHGRRARKQLTESSMHRARNFA